MPSRCSQCKGESPSGFRFCGHCGAALPAVCPACGAEVPDGFRFCGQCGQALPDAAAGAAPPEPLERPPSVLPAAQPPPSPGQESSERRRVAILFADVVGSTALSHRVDSEVSYQVISGCLEGLCEIVGEAGGYVVKTLGDGLMALFGAPVAVGDDPYRAGQAALRMQEWMRRYGEGTDQQYGIPLAVRIGINYGGVIAAPMTAGRNLVYDALGDSVNVAQRVEGSAKPGTVAVSESFYRITRRSFEYFDLGFVQLKGKPEPVRLYRIDRERQDREPADAGEALLPLTGRQGELCELQQTALRLKGGEGGVTTLTGEAGMGKSRLLDEFGQELAELGIPYLHTGAVDGWREAPLSVWRAWLLDLLRLDPGMPFQQAATRVAGALVGTGLATWGAWLAALAVDPRRLLTLDADARERVASGALRALLSYWQRGSPAALLIDDADRLDELSLRLLDQFTARGDAPLLVLLAARNRASLPPSAGPSIQLRPLDSELVSALLSQTLPAVRSDPELRETLVARSGGNPLFLTVIIRAVREVADPAALLAAVPDTLYGLVQAQIDSLPPTDRSLLHCASVLGNSFAESWLAALWRQRDAGPAGSAAAPWDALVIPGFFQERRPAPHRELGFEYPVLQEVLYEGLLRAQRQQEHGRAAAVIAEDAGIRPELAARVAWHWKCAEAWGPALTWSLKAADHYASIFGGEDARRLYDDALALADRTEVAEPAAAALAGLASLAAHRGEFPLAMEHHLEAMRRLGTVCGESCTAPGATPSQQVLWASTARAQARIQALTGAPAAAEPLLARALHLLLPHIQDGEQQPARAEYVRCLIEHAHVLCDLARLETAVAAARRSVDLAKESGWDAEVAAAGAALGRAYQLQGNWAAAQRELEVAAVAAAECRDWTSESACWSNLGTVLQSAGHFQRAIEALQRALDLSLRIGDVERGATVRRELGVVHLNRGDWDAAEAEFRGALGEFRAMEHCFGVTATLANLAETLYWQGRLPDAETVLAEAEALQPSLEVPYLEPYLTMWRAEMALARNDPAGAAELAAASLDRARELGSETFISGSRLVLGRALRSLGRLGAAACELEAARESFAAVGMRLEEARTAAELAAVLAAQGDCRAPALRKTAVEIIRDLGADPWLEHLP